MVIFGCEISTVRTLQHCDVLLRVYTSSYPQLGRSVPASLYSSHWQFPSLFHEQIHASRRKAIVPLVILRQ